MNTRYAQEEELEESETHESELTLSTPVLLGIFFGIVLVCGIFFGIGYSMGRRSGEAKAVAAAQNGSPSTSSDGTGAVASGLPKPSAVQQMTSPAAQAATSPYDSTASQTPSTTEQTVEPTQQAVQQDTTPRLTPVPAATKPVKPVTVTPAPQTAATPAAAETGTIMVQVAAVSHQPDAEALVSALKRKGYNAAIYSQNQDKLLHVQVGPFSSRAEAASKRQQLLAEGYNAIIK